jgi:hypothetical protein
MRKPNAVLTTNSLNHLTGTGVTLTFPDGTTDHVNVAFMYLASKVVSKAKAGDLKPFRAIKAINNAGEDSGDPAVLAKYLAAEWMSAPCLYLGVPNKHAMFLLTGLRRPVSGGWRSAKNGGSMRDFAVIDLVDAGLMWPATHNERVTFKTNMNGHALLDHWAEKNKPFAAYLNAYSPKGWKAKECERVAFALMEGKDAGLYPSDILNETGRRLIGFYT